MASLSAAGIAARADSENRVTLAKLVIVDGADVLIGSTNLTQGSMDRNNESNLLIRSGDAAKFYREYFDALWRNPRNASTLSRRSGDKESLYFTDGAFLDVAGERIDNASGEIDLVMYMVKMDAGYPAHPVTRLLGKVIEARKRGVRVRIVLEQSYPGAFNDHIDGFNKDAARLLRENGVSDILFDSPGQITHGKILLVDVEVLIGSTNWYEKGILPHHQAGVATRNKDAVKGMKEYFEAVYASCKEPGTESKSQVTP